MNEKKLEKLIVDGFKSQDKRFEVIERRFAAQDKRFDAIDRRFDTQNTKFEKKFDAIEKHLKKVEIDMVTQDDLDQRLQDQSDMLTTEMNKGFAHASDERAKISAALDRLDKRTDEDTRDLYKRVGVLEKVNGIVPKKFVQAK